MLQVTVIDRHGKHKKVPKSYIMQDGERLFIPVSFMDAATREVLDAMAQEQGVITDEMMQRVADAYEEGVRATCEAWRGPDNPSPTVIEDDSPARAYFETKREIQDAWRTPARTRGGV